MGNLSKDRIEGINQFHERKLREILYILSSDDIQSPLIPLQLRYPPFELRKKGIQGLDFKDWDLIGLKRDLDALSDQTALGRYTERLLSIWFKHNPNFELLRFNLQIVIEKRTVGEIDFLLLEKESGKAIQLEFAIKYFLGTNSSLTEMQFIGPKGRDSLEAKSKKLIDQQMQLSLIHNEQLDEDLREYDFRPQIMLKGVLFYPIGDHKKDNQWIYSNQINKLDQWNLGVEYVILKKRRDWLYPFDLELWHEPLTLGDCIQKLMELRSQIPLMIAFKRENGDFGRLMIVADSWPKPI